MDTFGVLSPHAARYFTRKVKERVDKPLEIHFHSDFVGHETPQSVMGKKSGLDNIEIWSKKLGIGLTEDKAMDDLKEVKLKSHDLKRILTEEEFKQIVETASEVSS